MQAPTLVIVGGDDVPVIGMNEQARDHMTADVHLETVPGALEQVAALAIADLHEHLR